MDSTWQLKQVFGSSAQLWVPSMVLVEGELIQLCRDVATYVSFHALCHHPCLVLHTAIPHTLFEWIFGIPIPTSFFHCHFSIVGFLSYLAIFQGLNLGL